MRKNSNIKKTPIILDGAMGTELINRGIECPLPLWSANANITHPKIVEEIHLQYVEAGASVITTNTFRSTKWTYLKVGYNKYDAQEKAKRSLFSAVQSAQKAKSDGVRVAGSITSVEDCYLPEKFPGKAITEETYGEILELFSESDLDIILFETMGNIHEIKIGLDLSQSIQIPVWLSVIMKDDKHILDGTPIRNVISIIPPNAINCLLINCNTLDVTMKAIHFMNQEWGGYWGAYPNLGESDYKNDYFNVIDTSNFLAGFQSMLKNKPDVIGVCCGSTPMHINQLTKVIPGHAFKD